MTNNDEEFGSPANKIWHVYTYMPYLRTMGAGLAGSLVKTYGNANVNQIQFGDKLQGLPSVTNRRVGVNRHVRTRGGGQMPGRSTVFCINQLGGIGNVKNSQFAPNADGVKDCRSGVYPYRSLLRSWLSNYDDVAPYVT